MSEARSILRRVTGFATDHPLVTIAGVAAAARLVVAVSVFMSQGGLVFNDDVLFWRLAGEVLDGADAEWSKSERAAFESNITFLRPLAVLRWLIDSPLVGQMWSVGMGTLAAVGAGALGLKAGGERVALVAGGVVALFPSQVFWSSLVLKDATVWAVTVATTLAVVRVIGGTLRAPGWILLSGVGLFGLLRVRGHSALVALAALGVTLAMVAWIRADRRRWLIVAGSIAAVVLLPLALGLGPAGSRLLQRSSLEDLREGSARGANPIVSDVDTTVDEGLLGHIRHLPVGLSAVVLRPYPWERVEGAFNAARVEAVLWYPLLLLAALGVRTLPNRPAWLWFTLLHAGGLILVYALAEGNLGTAYRHRSELLWIVAVLAAIGLEGMLDRRFPSAERPNENALR